PVAMAPPTLGGLLGRLETKDMRKALPLLLVLTAPLSAHAVEGGLGRSITGLQVTNYAGVVPPTPGWNLALGYAYYSGEIGAQRQLPISGVTALGVDASFGLTSLTGVYVWNTGEGRWNFAYMASLPYSQVHITAERARHGNPPLLAGRRPRGAGAGPAARQQGRQRRQAVRHQLRAADGGLPL